MYQASTLRLTLFWICVPPKAKEMRTPSLLLVYSSCSLVSVKYLKEAAGHVKRCIKKEIVVDVDWSFTDHPKFLAYGKNNQLTKLTEVPTHFAVTGSIPNKIDYEFH